MSTLKLFDSTSLDLLGEDDLVIKLFYEDLPIDPESITFEILVKEELDYVYTLITLDTKMVIRKSLGEYYAEFFLRHLPYIPREYKILWSIKHTQDSNVTGYSQLFAVVG